MRALFSTSRHFGDVEVAERVVNPVARGSGLTYLECPKYPNDP